MTRRRVRRSASRHWRRRTGGATRGIGAAAALALARQGAEVAVVGRDRERVAGTVAALGAAGGATGHVADQAQMAETRQLAAELLDAYPRIDVLAHDAGAMFSSRRLSDDGFEQTLALNHLSPSCSALLRASGCSSRGRGS